MAKKSIKNNQDEVLNEAKVPEDQVLHNTDGRKVEVKVPEINPASVVKIKALADTKHLKKDAYKRVIKKTQNNLSKTEKTFSKAIHNPVIEKVSDVSAKTVARPSGILFGSIGAFVASLVIYFISKRSGFEYNYLLFVMVFVGGYFIGLIAELFYKLIKPQKS